MNSKINFPKPPSVSLFVKVITPIIVLAIVLAFVGSFYISDIMKKGLEEDARIRLQSKIDRIEGYIKADFSILFNLYAKDYQNYIDREKEAKQEIINKFKNENLQNKDALYIFDKGVKNIIAGKGFSEELEETFAKTSNGQTGEFEYKNNFYLFKTFEFKPWGWKVVYILDKSKIDELIEENKNIIYSILFTLIFIVMINIFFILNKYIKTPVAKILEQLQEISSGIYNKNNEFYNTKEPDLIIEYLNKTSIALQDREQKAIELLNESLKKESYITDILNSQSNMIIVTNGQEIQDVNMSFLKFFDEFESLETFKAKHQCVCDYFEKEEGFIYSFDDENWVEHILKNPKQSHKAKVLKDTKVFIFELSAKKLSQSEHIIISLVDITDYEINKIFLEESNKILAEYKKAVDASAIVSKTDKNGFITYVNDHFAAISEYTKEELIGKNHNIVRNPNSPSQIFKELWQTIKNKHISTGQFPNRAKSGKVYYVNATIVPILDKNGNIVEYLALRYDVTALIEARERAYAAEKAKTSFLANMSHEIRTPLNAIIGFTKILSRSDKIPSREKEFIKIMDDSANHLLKLISDVLDMSKAESGMVQIESVEFDPIKEFESISELFIARAKEKGIDFLFFVDPRLPSVLRGDVVRVKQVVSNLIGNAIKFTDQNGVVRVGIRLKEIGNSNCKISFMIQDSGVGIPKEKQDEIFKPFVQADAAVTRTFGGTGLGLAISSEIIKLLGSKIVLESQEGLGSKFSFDVEFEVGAISKGSKDYLSSVKIAICKKEGRYEGQLEILKKYLETFADIRYVNEVGELTDDLDAVVAFGAFAQEIKEGNISIPTIFITDEIDIIANENKNIITLPINTSKIFNALAQAVGAAKFLELAKNDGSKSYEGKILVAEDNVANRELIGALLDERSIEHIFAHDGFEAVNAFKAHKFELILMDVNMPRLDGVEAMQKIKELQGLDFGLDSGLDQNAKIPVVALTANAIKGDRERFVELGFDDYLSKPIYEDALDGVLSKYLKQKIIQSDNNYKNGQKNGQNIDDLGVKNLKEFTYPKDLKIPKRVYDKILHSFLDNIDHDIEILQNGIKNHDINEVAMQAHKIKGAALNLRLEHISKAILEFEGIAKNGSFEFERELKNLLNSIEELKMAIQNR